MLTEQQLHMIENRTKIEKEIFLGRRAIRKVLRSTQSHRRLSEPPTQDNGIIHDFLKLPSRSPPGSDYPLSVDTEAEAAFTRGSRWYFRKGRGTPTQPSGRSVSPTGTTGNRNDHRGQPQNRYEVGPGDDQSMASTGGIFPGFRDKSFSRFPSEKMREAASRSLDIEQESSESSSETIDERGISQFSLIPDIATQDLPTIDCQSDEE